MWIGDVLLNRYRIERPIGNGGMGSVFSAIDEQAGGRVAVKVLDIMSDAAARRFKQEVRVLSELSHPGIVRYLGDGETEMGEPFLVMDLLSGADLAQRLTLGPLPLAEALRLVERVAEALTAAHARRIVHRDLKPRNLFLVNDSVDRATILDFGVAHARFTTQKLTETGTLLGTVGYMAPEQASGEGVVDARADVFSLGCVLFEALTGRPAFPGKNVIAVLTKIQAEPAPRVSDFVTGEVGALDRLLSRMLARSPDDRPSDAAALHRELGALSRAT
jgi:serine/threonine protein kinase